MPNTSVQAAAEGAPRNRGSLFLDAQDHISECIDFSRLICRAIEGMELDDDLRSLSAGVYAIEKKLTEAMTVLEEARRIG
ncbi:hypothetical protein PH552_16185 [Rhizobium sp. CNPSo 3968]|uniref:hypothetical protein n=1 Tax=Rhizobium sp. CNPSo 3968 TaxID=3021408 RepID=UPI00254F3F5A|nr:hypothetical protein [Rhizobium sp. CNPSo 3968]MDK4720884.1 hypothetical protein [Rhizobium sp. CNPSo 3968]